MDRKYINYGLQNHQALSMIKQLLLSIKLWEFGAYIVKIIAISILFALGFCLVLCSGIYTLDDLKFTSER